LRLAKRLALVAAIVGAIGTGAVMMHDPKPAEAGFYAVRCTNPWNPQTCRVVYINPCPWDPYSPYC
jgi:hypothetical protein